MEVVLTGHAGMFVRAGDVTVLCDPWFSPAYFGSWFPFPDNADVDVEEIASPDYLYISHLHKDHFDARFLAERVDKSATVIVPDFPLDELRAALEDLGFHRFLATRSGRPVELGDGIRASVVTSTSLSDGPIGDSALALDDGVSTILDQNDCHPRDLAPIRSFGPYDLHLLQYSGAIWYPMVYRLDPAERARLGAEKRQRQIVRALRYVDAVNAAHVVPFAGPPAFLDEDLFHLNDFDDDPSNIFQDQAGFLRVLARHGRPRGHLAVAGSRIEVGRGHFDLSHGKDPSELRAAFEDKRGYLLDYRERRLAELDRERPRATSAWTPDHAVQALADRVEPLLAGSPTLRRALGGPVVLDVERFALVIDPAAGTVRRWRDEEPDHWFRFDEALLRSVVERGVTDWVNELFLSCRFEAARSGAYNQHVFSLFKCLTPRRAAYLEASLALDQRRQETTSGPGELWRCGAYLVQRQCPHLGADLSRFSELEGGVLTCALHGHRFDIGSGRCLDGDCPSLFTFPATAATSAGAGDPGVRGPGTELPGVGYPAA